MSASKEAVKRINSRNSDTAPKEDNNDADSSASSPSAVPPSVKLHALYRFTTPSERALAIAALALAAVAGAMQPLMTIVFGSLTSAFTQYGSLQAQLAMGLGDADALLSQLSSAEDNVRVRARDAALYLLGIGIGMMLATYGYMVAFNYIGEINSKRLRETYLRSVLRQDIAYFDNVGAGEVATRIQTDCHLVQDGTSEKVAYVAQYLSTFVTGFIIAYVKEWRLALLLSTAIVMIGVISTPWSILADKWNIEMLEHYAQAGSLAEEIFGSVRTVKAFASEKVLGARFEQLVRRARASGRKVAGSDGVGFPLIIWVVWSMYACAFFYGGLLVSWQIASSGDVITVIFAIMIAAFSLAMIPDQLQAINKGKSAGSKLFETIDRVPLIDSASTAGAKLARLEGSISLHGVKFHYPSRPDVPILKDFTMDFPAGQSVALVGASGSGKSTIVSLVERFYDPIEGVVRVDGHDVRELNLRWLRQQIGLVSQEPTLFQTTVRGNVEHGLIGSKWESAPDAERFELVKKACIAANAHDFIMALPEGYDTSVGDRGMLLSGGQKQRVAIARAVVSDPRILLLDEATSALDTQSEGVVQDALDRASQGRTTITIAHRLSTIKACDKIIVMGAGEILEVGTHDELLSDERGAYAQLVSAQKLAEAKAREEEETATVVGPTPSGSSLALAPEKSTGSGPASSFSATQAQTQPQLGRAKTNLSVSHKVAEDLHQQSQDEEEALGRQVSIFRVAGRMYNINKKDGLLYVLGIVGGIAHGMVYPALAILFGKTIEDFQIQDAGEMRAALRGRALWYFVSAFAAAVVSGLQMGLTGVTGQNLSARLRTVSMEHTLKHDVQWFDEKKNSVGALTSNLSNHPQKVMGLFGATLGTIAYAAATVVGGSVIGLAYAPLLALIGIACLPLIVSQGIIRLKVITTKDEKTKKIHESSAHLASEAAAAVRTVAALTREEDVDRIYQHALEEPLRISLRTSLYAQALYAVSQGLLYPIMSLVFWVGAQWLLSGRYSTSQFFIVLIAVVFASNEASHFFSFVPDASKAKSAASAIFRLIDYTPKIERPLASESTARDQDIEASEKALRGTKRLESVAGQIKLEDVHFRYPSRPGVRVLRDLDLTIEPGSFVALVGPSGCGKSTTIQMLERFYDPLAGRVLLDGHDVKELDLGWYRSQIALVSQEPMLYSGSIRFNILLGANKPAEEVTEAELVQACKDANIYDFIMSLPDGLETDVGGKGSQLSGGQKQRIAIARALIRNPKILLLDEATSALDSTSERVVQAALDQAAKGRTTVAIAHRLSSIQHADLICCFKEGKVHEMGTHDELLALKGQYFELVQMQNLSKKDE